MRTKLLHTFVVGVTLGMLGCGGTDNPLLPPGGDVGGDTSANPTGGNGPTESGGTASVPATGGTTSVAPTGGAPATGGAATGGRPPTGGVTSVAPTGGATSVATGGAAPTGGRPSTGGTTGVVTAGGKSSTGGGTAGGGKTGTGGASAVGGGSSTVNCSGTALSGGTQHCSSNQTGTSGSYGWSIWSSGSGGCITTYSAGAAFKATWNNSGDFLAREGCSWNETKTYDKYGDITADYAYSKTGSAGGYSYIGIYGWSNNPLIEFYIVDDWYGNGPPSGGGTQVGTFTQDGGTYKVLKHQQVSQPSIHGTATFWQYFSVRQTARQCGHIDVSAHFKEWASLGLNLGNMYEAKIVVEAGGGSGSIDYTLGAMTCN